MPIYEYVCPNGHVTEQRGGLDDAEILCPECLEAAVDSVYAPLRDEQVLAHRRPAYLSQGVIFPGVGFTRTVIPPASPKTTTIPGEPVADWFEKTDEYAERQYRDDEHYRDHRKDQVKKMIGQVKRGALT